jgi:hypothetical protein
MNKTINYESMKLPELKKYCKENQIKKISGLKKKEIVKKIEDGLKVTTQQTQSSSTHPPHIPVSHPPELHQLVDKTVLENGNIVILNNDCMAELNKLNDNSIDCVITDPPYFIDKLDNTWSSDMVNKDVKNSHVKHLPKGMKFNKSQGEITIRLLFGIVEVIV